MTTSTGINISAIERDLAELWREEAAGDEEQRAVTRARVLTLIIYDEKSASSANLEDTIYAVTEMHPARVLVLSVDPTSKESSVEAVVTAACRVAGQRSKQLSCEQVNFTALGSGADELPSAVAQLLAPDVPVFLWWRAAPDLDNYVFNHLIKMADRVLFDSTVSSTPREGFVRLAQVLASGVDFPALTDFAWQRLTPWRELIASFYDMPDHRPYLDRVDSLTIEYHPHTEHSDITTRSILLASWLAERLQWTLDADASSHDGNNNRFVFRKNGREIVTTFVPIVREGFQDLLASATLGVSGDDGAQFRVMRNELKQLSSEIRMHGTPHTSRVLAYRSKNEGELLATELSISGHDRLYEAAIRVAGQIGSIKQD